MKLNFIIGVLALSFSTMAAAALPCKEDFENRMPGYIYNPIAKCSVLISSENTDGEIGNPVVDICIGSNIDPKDKAKVIYITGHILSDPNVRNAANFIDPRVAIAMGEFKNTVDGSKLKQVATETANSLDLRQTVINPSAVFDTNKDNSDFDMKIELNKSNMKLTVQNWYRTNWPFKNPKWKKTVSYVLQCELDN